MPEGAYKSSFRHFNRAVFCSGSMKQKRKYRLSRKGKVEQFRIIRPWRMACSKRLSAVTPSFSIRARIKLAVGR